MVRYPLQWSNTVIPFFRPEILINHNMGITFQATYQVITQRTNLEAASRHNYGKNSLHEQNYECF